jgi:hypothetical protein
MHGPPFLFFFFFFFFFYALLVPLLLSLNLFSPPTNEQLVYGDERMSLSRYRQIAADLHDGWCCFDREVRFPHFFHTYIISTIPFVYQQFRRAYRRLAFLIANYTGPPSTTKSSAAGISGQ